MDNTALDTLLPVLVKLQTRLDEDLSLERVSGWAGYSPFHFHRVFKEAVGETLKEHTRRLRLERAAFQLVVRDAPIVDVALDAGFASHQAFTRAFKARFGVSPSAYRSDGQRSWQERAAARPGPARATGADETSLEERLDGFELSTSTVRPLQPMRVAFIRNVGPYEQVDGTSWERLDAWSRRHGHRIGGLLGIAQDAPGITPSDRLRFDACVLVGPAAAAEGEIGIQVIPAAHYLATLHVGPYSTLGLAYQEISGRLARLDGYRVVGIPSVELYRSTVMRPGAELNHTEICLPVEPLRPRS